MKQLRFCSSAVRRGSVRDQPLQKAGCTTKLVGAPSEPGAQLVQQGLRRLVATEAQIALELERRDPLLVTGDEEVLNSPGRGPRLGTVTPDLGPARNQLEGPKQIAVNLGDEDNAFLRNSSP